MRFRFWLLVATAVALLIAIVDTASTGHALFDISVYRQGAIEVADHTGQLYEFDLSSYPFTYPPFAALVLLPMAWVPLMVLQASWPLLLIPTMVLFWYFSFRAATPGESRRLPPGPIFVALVAIAMWRFETVELNYRLGQVNFFLALMILLDLVGPVKARWRGILIGLASAIKLTPLVFVFFLAVTRQWTALRNALATFFGAMALGFVVLPEDSWRYWTELLLDSSRIGPVDFARNQSVMSTIVRFGAEQGTGTTTLLWLAVAGFLGCTAMALAVWCWHTGEQLLGVGMVAMVSLLASPISWTHHWIWVIPIGIALAHATRRWTGSARRGWLVAAAWWSVFWYTPHRGLPSRLYGDPGWNAWEQFRGADYIWASLVLLAYVGFMLNRQRLRARGSAPEGVVAS